MPHPDRNVAVFDVDGTISDDSHRAGIGPWLFTTASPEERNRLWDVYYAQGAYDVPIWPVFDIAEGLRRLGFLLVLAAGRPERLRGATMKWLREHHFPAFDDLLMRPEGVRVGNADMKALHAVSIGPERVALWVDDHPGVPAALAPYGIPVLGLHNPVWAHPEDPAGAGR